MYQAITANATILAKGNKVRDFRDLEWTFQSVTHPRKVYVTRKDDPNGPETYPNLHSREFYASVFNLGIWDTETQSWTFEPEWHPSITTMVQRTIMGHTSLLKH